MSEVRAGSSEVRVTATDELRRLLDEREVEWRVGDYPTTCTVWESDGIVWHGLWRDGCIELIAWQVTPSQAIDATLGDADATGGRRDGAGTCHVDVLNTGDCAGYECSEYIMHCNGCGHEFGHVLYNEDGDVWMSQPPNYCPNCGAKVVEP